jgi:hypothetical protein
MGLTFNQIRGDPTLLATAQDNGYPSVDAMIPGISAFEDEVSGSLDQLAVRARGLSRPTAPFAILSVPGAISVQTLMHAVEETGLPLLKHRGRCP